MAGVEKEFLGEAWPADGTRVGYLPQEPELDPRKDVLGNVEEGVAEARALLGRFEEVSVELGEPMSDDEMQKLLDEQARAPRRASTRRTPGSSIARSRSRWTRCALPPADAEVDDALGRRAPPRRALPPSAAEARPAAARRADEPSRRGIGRVARASPAGVSGHGRRDHARPLLPRQRRRLDPRARPRRRHSLEGQLLLLARAEAAAPRDRGEAGIGAPADARARARMGADGAAGATGEEQGASQGLRAHARRRRPSSARDDLRDPDSAGPAPRRSGRRGQESPQGLRRPPADRRSVLLAAARRDRRRHRPQRRRQDDARSA